MSDIKLDQEDLELLQDIENGDFTSVLTLERKAELSTAAEQTVKKISGLISVFLLVT